MRDKEEMSTPEEYHGEENIEFTTQLIIRSYSLPYQEAREWAVKALDGFESHGFGAANHAAVREVVRVVASSWLKLEVTGHPL